ncbi:hypothetical protein PIB30_048069 [Stylosanthes scabra]|uniref:Putative plant transposon protein domain-containing protein n=1 Tax=Stylosanthes scabra TaxID=79078 RepID=A0ABU6UGP1_9FABA|nr:hypothetical protein [Stylosanthes scabra]
MAGLLKKRKEKAVAQLSKEVPRFKTLFHEAHFKGKLSAWKVLPEVPIDYNDDILLPCAIQIKMRKWEKFTAPLQAVGHNLVKEFYANAWELDKDKRKPYTYTTMVQGKDISFAPKDIKRVLKLKSDPFPNAASYHEKKANKDYKLEEVQECLCLEGREWVRHRDERPHYLRRNDLEPMAQARQFREMEAQGIPVTIANVAIHRHKEKEMNQERMRHNQEVQEARAEREKEANKGKAREVVPDSEEEESEEMHSSSSEE